MGGKPIPKNSILAKCKAVSVQSDRKIFKDPFESIYYTWDSMHGEVEVFNKKGYHIGVACPTTGEMIKPAVKGRRLKKLN